MRCFSLILLVLGVISCGRKSAAIEVSKEDRIEKLILLFDTPVRFAKSMLLWDANLSEIIFIDISDGMLIYDKNIGAWTEGYRPRSIRFIADLASASYIKDSLKLLPSDLNYVDSTIVDDGTNVEWMVVYESGKLYESNYNTPTENHARLACYIIDLAYKQHPDSLSKAFLLNLRNEKK